MGQEIERQHFSAHDFRVFSGRLRRETELLRQWLDGGVFPDLPFMGGLEVEAWLVGPDLEPAAENGAFLEAMADPLVVPELAAFNFEINTDPLELAGAALTHMESDLDRRWKHCRRQASELGLETVMTGILPTARETAFSPANMSDQARYRALNEQILRSREGRPLHLQIEGRERLDTVHYDVMLEAAATSFQIHLRVPPSRAAHFFNAALLCSPFMVAASANSPFLFGRDLWEETRIPLFEQSVASPPRGDCASMGGRVCFGRNYVSGGLARCFSENEICFDPLLPMEMDKYPASLSHLRLHNGTIWRWNRPLVGFEDDGRPHLRIEHRSCPAGPTVADSIANAALFYALCADFADESAADEQALQRLLPFDRLRDGFYRAARDGLNAELSWIDGRTWRLRDLLLDQLLPRGQDALARMGLDGEGQDRYMRIIEERVRSGRTGSAWQRQRARALDGDLHRMLREYMDLQDDGEPVHSWPV
ncbi:MAG: glutamate-cysteine ligase family protein [Gammaproteobacteria bacterium]